MNSRLIVSEPEPVKVDTWRDMGQLVMNLLAWLGTIAIVVAAGYFGLSQYEADNAPLIWPDDGPSEVFGTTMQPEPLPCHCESCDDPTWLARFVNELDVQSKSPREIRDVLNRCYAESRYTPSVVSDTGDYGICQINAAAWPDVDTMRLLGDPEYAAVQCLRVYRVYFKACGDQWRCCYVRGVAGCRRAK